MYNNGATSSSGWNTASGSGTSSGWQPPPVQQQAYMANEADSENGTDTDTISSLGDGMYELPTGDIQEQAAEIFWQYQQNKSKWRSFMGRPTRKVRRLSNEKAKAKGKDAWEPTKGKERDTQSPSSSRNIQL